MKVEVKPVGRAPLNVDLDQCVYCDAVRQHFKHEEGGVAFFEVPSEPHNVRRVEIVAVEPTLLLFCETLPRVKMDEEMRSHAEAD